MTSRAFRFAMRLLALLAATGVEAQAQAQAPAQAPAPVVSGVEIRGTNDASLARHLTIRIGEPSDPETIRSTVLLLSAMDLFDEVAAEEEPQADGTVHLVFQVQETSRVGDLVFVTRTAETGVEVPLPSGVAKGLTQVASLRRGEPFRERTLEDARARMTEWLRMNAYRGATVEVQPQATEEASRRPGPIRDLKILVLKAKQEVLASSRIDGWPRALPPPPSPAKVGEALTDETLARWRENLLAVLWKSSHYRAQVRTESVAGDLVFFVTPGPPFDLKLGLLNADEGARALSRFQKEGLSQEAIEETMSAIETDFLKRGYRDVEVDFQETPAGSRMTGEFVVRPGKAWVVGSVEYQVDSVPTPRVSPLATQVPWIDADIEAERTRLLVELVQDGYAGASVTHEESGDPANAKVIFKIVPGSLTTISSVVLEGAPPAQDRSHESAVELKTRESQPLRNADVARDRTALIASLRDDGYIDARVEATTEFSDDRSTVVVTFHVNPGPRVRVGRIMIIGLEVTKPLVVLRESRLKEGDFLSYQKLLDTQSSLSGTGLFTSVQIRELESEEDERDLIIEVVEGPRTTIVPGLGYAQDDSFRGSLELTRLNISGHGRTASVFVRGSVQGSKKALVSFTEPYAFHRRQSLNVQVYGEDDRSRPDFDFQRVGFQASTTFPVLGGNIITRYTFQNTVTLNVETSCAEVNRTLCDGKISGPSIGYVHDTRNDAIYPRRGMVYSFETLLSASKLGGDSFLKGSVFVARYDEVRAGLVIAASGRLGLSRAFGSTTELPLPERFFAGGPSLMRAFKTDEVGPGDLNEAGEFVPSGGNALLAFALEARFDVFRSFGVQAFAETGNVYSQVNELAFRDFREVGGIGITYRSPFGPLRLDWGFKLDRRPGEDRHQLHLAVGYAF
jgi:outer membrane protein insertion porin family